MPPFVLIGLAAGLVSALLFVSATAGNPAGRFLLFFLTPLPGFLAGLGWGAIAAGISAVAASIGCGLLLGPRSAVVVFLSQGLPIAILCHLALLSRVAPALAQPQPASPGPAPALEWYPPGRLVAIATVMAGLLAALSVLLLGSNLDEMRTALRDLLEKVFLQQLPMFQGRTLTEAEKVAATEFMLYAFPAASALSWLSGLLLNFYLAGRITLASGRLQRPWPDLPAMTYPRGFGSGLAAALIAVALLDGLPALLASGFAGAFVLAYLLLGLAIAHYVTRGVSGRGVILWAIYLGLFLVNPWVGLALALLGAVEPVLPFRRWKERGPPGRPDQPST